MRIDTLPEEDQHALGHELADLAVAMGPAWLLDAPILLPRPADFPDQWRPDLDGNDDTDYVDNCNTPPSGLECCYDINGDGETAVGDFVDWWRAPARGLRRAFRQANGTFCAQLTSG